MVLLWEEAMRPAMIEEKPRWMRADRRASAHAEIDAVGAGERSVTEVA